jgi:F-type H+-transporting ATPase subunit epsilon
MTEKKRVQFTVITPERQVLEDSADSVVFAAHDGEMGILCDRAPLMCELGIGQLRYRSGSHTRRLFIDGGFAQVHDNSVTVLTQQAIPAENITAETVQNAEQAITKLTGHDPETLEARRRAQRRARVLRELRESTPHHT